MKYPNLSKSKVVSFDIETYDPELKEKGPGVYRRDGNILGVAISNGDFSEYYDLGHKKLSPEIKAKNHNYVKDILATDIPKLGTNILYDIDWLENWSDMKIKGKLHDIQVAEPLLDENQGHYSLDFQMKKYLNKTKFPTRMVDFCEQRELKGDCRKHLYMMPVDMVREYAVSDVENPIEIFKLQWSQLKKENLLPIYDMEMRLYPLLLQMRKVGVRIDKEKVYKGIDYLKKSIKKGEKDLYSKYRNFNYNSPKQLALIMDEKGIMYPLTEKNNPHLDKSVLESMDNDLSKQVLNLRGLTKTLSTFFINSFLGHSVSDRIHCSFHPLKTGEYGAISGRFSSANPNLQQIPSKEEIFMALCRSVFIPEEDCWWGKLDWNQIEYRIICHYARGPKAQEVRDLYNQDPKTDYHQLIMDWTGLTRKDAKVMNFGMAYAMGAATLSKKFGWPFDQALEYIERYNEEVPFVKATRNYVTKIARGRGYIKTILGRRARVTEVMRQTRKEYVMFNRLIQGSSADVLKKSMVAAYEAGVFKILTPHLTVHDELDVSVPKNKIGMEAFEELHHIMENCVKLKVPINVDAEIGESWGELMNHDFKQGILM